jgi:sedoheptulokinase
MHAIGLDIGTTTLSAVVVETQSGRVLESLTVPNGTELIADSCAMIQDPEAIFSKAQDIVTRLLLAHPGVRCIGLTGQMHGILYTDIYGRSVSPLYTWQDGHGDLRMQDGRTYSEALSELTGRALATGYGAVTHYYNLLNGCIPKSAVWAMTIQDYIGMRFTGRQEPLLHASDTQSFGAPEWPELARMIRTTSKTECLGQTAEGILVSVAIGDNQASFIGSVNNAEDSVLVNMGTGGQISVVIDKDASCEGVETRPYVDGGSLLVGFSLCGGRAYALLEALFRDIASLAGAAPGSLYLQMNALADLQLQDPLHVKTLFSGTRQDPNLRGVISNISTQNLTSAHLVQGVLYGMVDELYGLYIQMHRHRLKKPVALVGSGNGLRQNPALRKLFERAFGMHMLMPSHCEEAAYGAALFALAACGAYASVAEAQKIMRYEESAVLS